MFDSADPETENCAFSRNFATTHWTRVLEAGGPESPAAQEAFAELYRDYRYPLYAYIRRRGYGPQDAEDLTQIFFERLIRNEGLTGIQREGGLFRSYLLAALSRLLATQWTKARAQKRGAGAPVFSLDDSNAETRFLAGPAEAPAELCYDREWAFTVLERVANALRQEYERDGKLKLFDALRPLLLADAPNRSHAQLAAELGTTEGAIKIAVHRLRQRYGRKIREEISRTVSTPEEVSRELRYLIQVVSS